MTTETDTLYSSLGEAERYAKDLEAKLALANLVIDDLVRVTKRLKSEGSYVMKTAAFAWAIEQGEQFIRPQADAV